MKKLSFALTLMLAVCMLFSQALAADAAILTSVSGDEWLSASTGVVAGDTLYILADSNRGTELYYWKEDMPRAEKLADNLFYASYYSGMEDVEEVVGRRNGENGTALDPQYTMSLLFAQGDQLMGLNAYNGKIFTVDVADGKAVYTDVAVMTDTSLLYHVEADYSYLLGANQYAVAGGKLLYLAEDYDQEGWQQMRLVSVDLQTGECKQTAAEHVQRVAAYKDGKVILLCRDDKNAYNSETQEMAKPDVYLYDPAADTMEKLGQYESERLPYLVYSENLDAMVYCENCRIMAMPDLNTATQVGYIPQDWVYNVSVLGDTFLNCSGDVMGRSISADYRSDVYLTVYNDYMDEGSLIFAGKYPQVPVYMAGEYYSTMEELGQAMVAGENSLDLLRMNTAYDSFFRLMDKGYCADLSGNAELMAYAQRLQPAFRDALMKDGKLYALPLYAYSYDGWYVANGVMEDMGLTMEDIPTNFVELCQFATRWNDEWVEEYPQYTLIEYCENYKSQMFYYMVNGYVNYCTAAGQEVRFSSPEFRTMLEALEAMRVDDLTRGANLENEDEVGYRQGLFMPSYTVVGDFGSDNQYRTFVPMTLTADTPYATAVNMEVMFINPRCENMEEAMNLLLCKLQAVDSAQRSSVDQAYTLFADKTEPVENEYYQRNIESIEKYIAQMEKDLADMPEEEKKDFQLMLDNERAYLESYKENERWSISAEDIKRYREEIVPCMFVARPTFLNSSQSNAAPELATLMERYLAGQITMDQFIRDADNKIMMMQMEDY